MGFAGRDASFTDEQHQLAEVAGDLFAAAEPAARARALWGDDAPRGLEFWEQIAALGLTAIGATERFGGMDGGPQDLVLVLEQAGRHLLPEALDATVAVAVPTLVEAAEAGEAGLAAARRWLPAIVAGEATAACALAGMPHVRDLDEADLVLVEREGTLWLAEGPHHPLQRVAAEDGTRRLFRRPDLTGTLLGGQELLASARRRALLANAAQLVGVMDHLVESCVGYARVRRQFGSPIGSFQAIQHRLVDMFVGVESARGAVRHAARLLHEGRPDAGHATHVAKAAVAEAHQAVNRDALQVFAGIGFTWEHDLHLWLKRGLALELDLGGAREHRRAVADRLFAGA